MTLAICPVRPDSRGNVMAKSADPLVRPVIRPNYLSAPADIETLLAGIEVARRIAHAPAFDPFRGREYWPGDGVTSRDAMLAAIRDWAETIYHPVGTCRMGADPRSVLTPDLRVRGVEGLRVVDASVMPTLVSGNTNVPAMMIAEKASDMILEDLRERPSGRRGSEASPDRAGGIRRRADRPAASPASSRA